MPPLSGLQSVVLMQSGPYLDSGDVEGRRRMVQLRQAGLMAAYHRNETVVSAWMRHPTGGFHRWSIMLASTGEFPARSVPGASTGTRLDVPVVQPLGSRGLVLSGDDAASLLGEFPPCWTTLAGVLRDDDSGVDAGAGSNDDIPGLEDVLGHLVPTDLAWVVIAHPVPAATIGEHQSNVAAMFGDTEHERLSWQQGGRYWKRQYRDLELAKSQGLWDLQLMIGACDAEQLQLYEGVVAATISASSTSFQVVPTGSRLTVDEALNLVSPDFSVERLLPEPQSPFVAPTSFVDSVARVPERELPGWRLEAPNPFDVAFEGPVVRRGSTAGQPYWLGEVLDAADAPAAAFTVSDSTLVRHTFVCGATGGGKSITVRRILEELSKQGRRWLVIEPAKAEYGDSMATRLAAADTDGVYVIRVGDLDVPPAMLNPLEPQEGFELNSHIELVEALFVAAFDAVDPFPQVVASSLRRAYIDRGWNLDTGSFHGDGEPSYPSLGDLQAAALAEVEEIGYGVEVKGNISGFMKVRLGSLRLGSSGHFFEGGHPIDMAALLEHNVVLEVDRVGSDQDKAFVMGVLLLRLFEFLTVRSRTESNGGAGQPDNGSAVPELRHLTVIEEAHRLLRRSRAEDNHAVETFAALLAEVRSYGEGLVIAEQIPTKVIPDVIKNTALRIVHRLPAGDDRELVGASMNFSPEHSASTVSFLPGRAAVFSEGMDRPNLVAIRGETEVVDAAARPQDRWLPFLTDDAHPAGSAMRGHLKAGRSSREIAAAREFIRSHPELELWLELLTISVLRSEDPQSLVGNFTADAATRYLQHLEDQRPIVTREALVAELVGGRVGPRFATGLDDGLCRSLEAFLRLCAEALFADPHSSPSADQIVSNPGESLITKMAELVAIPGNRGLGSLFTGWDGPDSAIDSLLAKGLVPDRSWCDDAHGVFILAARKCAEGGMVHDVNR